MGHVLRVISFQSSNALVYLCISALFYMGGLTGPHQVAAQAGGASNPVYTIANFEVWAEAKDAVAAKNLALEDGKRVALEQLLKRLTVYAPQRKLPNLNKKEISRLIASIAVKDERNSKTEYLANINFKFSEKAVKQLMNSHNLAYWDKQVEPVIVVPVVHQSLLTPKAGEREPLLSQEDWVTSWKTLDLPHGLVPITIKERLAIIDDTVLASLLRDEQAAREGMLKAYDTQRVVIALLSASAKRDKVHFTLVGRDSIGDVIHKQDHIVSKSDLIQAADLTAEVAQGLLENRVKFIKRSTALGQVKRPAEVLPWQTKLQETAPITGWQGQAHGQRVVMQVQFQGLRHWQSIRSRLESVQGLNGLTIDKLSARAAEVSCTFPGGANALLPALRAKGLSLEQAGNGWLLFEG